MAELQQPRRQRLKPLSALLRVLAAPGFVLMLWALQLLWSKLLGNVSRSAAAAGMGTGGWLDDGHRLRALAELMMDNPALPAVIATTFAASALAAALFSIVSAPALLTRLDGERSLAKIFGSCGAHLPAMALQTVYGLVFRALCTGLGALALMAGPGGLVLTLIFAAFPVLVLDRARASVVLEGERPYHPMTFLRAIPRVAKRPSWWLAGAALDTLKVGVGIAALLLVLQGTGGGGSIWIARGAGVLALVLGLWRVGLAVEDARAPLTPRG